MDVLQFFIKEAASIYMAIKYNNMNIKFNDDSWNTWVLQKHESNAPPSK